MCLKTKCTRPHISNTLLLSQERRLRPFALKQVHCIRFGLKRLVICQNLKVGTEELTRKGFTKSLPIYLGIERRSSLLAALQDFCPVCFHLHASHPSSACVFEQVCERTGDLLLCEGHCYAAFHPECISLSAAPKGKFFCGECSTGERRIV